MPSVVPPSLLVLALESPGKNFAPVLQGSPVGSSGMMPETASRRSWPHILCHQSDSPVYLPVCSKAPHDTDSEPLRGELRFYGVLETTAFAGEWLTVGL